MGLVVKLGAKLQSMKKETVQKPEPEVVVSEAPVVNQPKPITTGFETSDSVGK